MDKLLLFITFFVPLSIPLSEFMPKLGIDMALPTEPIIAGLMLIFFLRIIYKNDYDKKIFYHPVSYTIIFSFFWILITAITSTIPVVSLKFFLSRLWFVVVFFYINAIFFKEFKNYKTFIWLYSLPLVIVIAYTLNNHLSYGLFDQKAANFACNPFYKDHTAYGAALAMIIFPVFGFIINKKSSFFTKTIAFLLFALLFIAIIFSYSRAAWISIVGALLVLVVILLKIKFKHLAITTIVLSIIGVLVYNQLMEDLEKNKQDSSGNFEKHLQSIYNVKTDASNVERLNRWACALRMFKEKPLLGWGPGTYMFQYAPFQLSYQKTIISTNTGDRGNAHSEYLGPLSEQGVLGLIAFLLILVYSIYTGLHAYKYATDKEIKLFILMTLLGLITYYIHGLLNNFLDTDKLSILFWGYIAFLTTADIYYTNQGQINNNKKF
jgi:putative inorganic carbon (HCO3(-)) transporter